MSFKEYRELLREEALFYRRHPEMLLCWVVYAWSVYEIVWGEATP